MKSDDENQYDIIPLEIYQTLPITPGSKGEFTFDFSSKGIDHQEEELLYLKEESEITLKLIRSGFNAAVFFEQFGINIKNAWIFHEPLTKKLVPSFGHDKPGDIDLIAGHFMPDGKTPSFEYIVGMQIKMRKVTAEGNVRPFPSGEGKTQTHYTAKLGFDRTYLLHIFLQEPRPVPDGYAKSWNTIHNSNFGRAIKLSSGRILKELSNESFGYAYWGWGQAYGASSFELGSISKDILYEAPLRPFQNDQEVAENKRILIRSLEESIRAKYHACIPLIIKI